MTLKKEEIFNGSFLIGGLLRLIVACSNPTDTISPNNFINATTETSEASYYNDIIELTEGAAAQPNATFGGRIESWTDNRLCSDTKITLQKAVTSNSDTLTIDFGTSGCTDLKGNVRKGRIVLVFSPEKRFVPLATQSINLVNFFINGVKVEGTSSVALLSPSVEGDILYEVTLTGGKFTYTDASTATREDHHFSQWTRNRTPLDLSDDEQKVFATYQGTNSTSHGVNRKGYEYSILITEDIVYKTTCLATKVFVPVAGKKEITVTKNAISTTSFLDYGNGACDKTVTVSVDGQSRNIEMKRGDNG